MEEPMPTRQELRAIITDPRSTQEQVLQAKLVCARRATDGAEAVRQICERYGLTREQTEELTAAHRNTMGGLEARAREGARQLEQLLAELQRG